MVDVGGPGDFMPEALDRLGAGDILTHCFTGGGATIIDEDGAVRREAVTPGRAASIRHRPRLRQLLWASARAAAIADDFPPDSISTDLHFYSVTARVRPGYDDGQIPAPRAAPPEVVATGDIGGPRRSSASRRRTLRPGAHADVAVFRALDEPIRAARCDAQAAESGRQRLQPVLTVVAGLPIDPASVQIAVRPAYKADRL